MSIEFVINPSPIRADYLRSQRLNPSNYLSYTKKVYSTTFKPASWPAVSGGIFNDLLLEGADHLLLEDNSVLYLEDSSSQRFSLIYLFRDLQPLIYGGVDIAKSSGSDLENLAIVFPMKFFIVGDVMVFEVRGQITANSTNSSLTFTVTFPDTATPATLSMPATVGANELADFVVAITSSFGADASGTGIVSHTGRMTVKNSGITSGESTTLLSTVQNTLDYNDVLYYLPQVEWTTQNAGNDVDFYSASLTVM
jgi:hypothetical protein